MLSAMERKVELRLYFFCLNVWCIVFLFMFVQTKHLKMKNKLQDLIINVTVPLAWFAIASVAIFVMFLFPQLLWNLLCK